MNPLITVFSIISSAVIGTISFSIIKLDYIVHDEQVSSTQNIESKLIICDIPLNQYF